MRRLVPPLMATTNADCTTTTSSVALPLSTAASSGASHAKVKKYVPPAAREFGGTLSMCAEPSASAVAPPTGGKADHSHRIEPLSSAPSDSASSVQLWDGYRATAERSRVCELRACMADVRVSPLPPAKLTATRSNERRVTTSVASVPVLSDESPTGRSRSENVVGTFSGKSVPGTVTTWPSQLSCVGSAASRAARSADDWPCPAAVAFHTSSTWCEPPFSPSMASGRSSRSWQSEISAGAESCAAAATGGDAGGAAGGGAAGGERGGGDGDSGGGGGAEGGWGGMSNRGWTWMLRTAASMA